MPGGIGIPSYLSTPRQPLYFKETAHLQEAEYGASDSGSPRLKSRRIPPSPRPPEERSEAVQLALPAVLAWEARLRGLRAPPRRGAFCSGRLRELRRLRGV